MKKILVLLLALMMVVALVACGAKEPAVEEDAAGIETEESAVQTDGALEPEAEVIPEEPAEEEMEEEPAEEETEEEPAEETEEEPAEEEPAEETEEEQSGDETVDSEDGIPLNEDGTIDYDALNDSIELGPNDLPIA